MINRMKLKNKLIMIFIIFSLTIISLIGIISTIYIKHNFSVSAQERIDTAKKDVYSKVLASYKNGVWDTNKLDFVGYSSIEKGLIICIDNDLGNTIWDARQYNNLECEKSLATIRNNTNKINPSTNIENNIETLDLKLNENIIGQITFEYIGPLYFDDTDVILFNMLRDILLLLCFVFLILSVILGITVSSSLNKPILKVIKSIELISKGNYSTKISDKSNIDEVNLLITSVNKMVDNIKHQENLRKIMTRDISHELRTPLTIIQSQLEAIMDGLWEPSKERLESIHDELQRLNRLIVSSDELFKYDSGPINLNKTNIDISKVINTILINFEKDLLDKNIKLKSNINKCNAFVDKDKISQVIVNILSNSLKYTNPNGSIFISCFEKNSLIYISIKDTGIGIKKNDLDNIFERFYRADKSRNSSSGGLGVGLTISKTIVEAHAGSIIVNSELGTGTEFIITLGADFY
ncbi:MAG: sensor histidine kinase [Clostridium sp.]